MKNEDYNKKVKKIIEKAKSKGHIKTYDEFCKTKESSKYDLSEDETIYYTSEEKENENK